MDERQFSKTRKNNTEHRVIFRGGRGTKKNKRGKNKRKPSKSRLDGANALTSKNKKKNARNKTIKRIQ